MQRDSVSDQGHHERPPAQTGVQLDQFVPGWRPRRRLEVHCTNPQRNGEPMQAVPGARPDPFRNVWPMLQQ